MRVLTILACLLGFVLISHGMPRAAETGIRIAAAPQAEAPPAKDGNDDEEDSPEDKMEARFPQPVKVGFLIGLPVLDWQDSTIGYVSDVVKNADGDIQLIVPYHPRLGFIRSSFPFERRPIAVPIEVVAILARQIAALDMPREEFDKAPTWDPGTTHPIPRDETIKIAVTRR